MNTKAGVNTYNNGDWGDYYMPQIEKNIQDQNIINEKTRIRLKRYLERFEAKVIQQLQKMNERKQAAKLKIKINSLLSIQFMINVEGKLLYKINDKTNFRFFENVLDHEIFENIAYLVNYINSNSKY